MRVVAVDCVFSRRIRELKSIAFEPHTLGRQRYIRLDVIGAEVGSLLCPELQDGAIIRLAKIRPNFVLR
jgi:hypothetical protein